MNPLGFLVLAAALVAVLAAVGNWNWFMVRVLVVLIGRNGARLFYVLIAMGLLWLGVMMLRK